MTPPIRLTVLIILALVLTSCGFTESYHFRGSETCDGEKVVAPGDRMVKWSYHSCSMTACWNRDTSIYYVGRDNDNYEFREEVFSETSGKVSTKTFRQSEEITKRPMTIKLLGESTDGDLRYVIIEGCDAFIPEWPVH